MGGWWGHDPNTTAPHQTALTSVNMPRRVPDPHIHIGSGIWWLKPTFLLLPRLFSGSMLDSGSVNDKHGSDSTPFISGIKIRTNSAAVFEAGNFRTTLKSPGKTAQFRTDTWNFGSPILLGWSSDKFTAVTSAFIWGILPPSSERRTSWHVPSKVGYVKSSL